MPDWRAIAATIAQNAGLPPSLFVRQIDQESGFDPAAVSPAGARGIAQIVPQYHPGVDPMDPFAALKYAANWMAQLHEQYGNWRDALAHYNGGGGAVEALHAGHPFSETVQYLSAILGPTTAEAAESDQSGPTTNTGGSSVPDDHGALLPGSPRTYYTVADPKTGKRQVVDSPPANGSTGILGTGILGSPNTPAVQWKEEGYEDGTVVVSKWAPDKGAWEPQNIRVDSGIAARYRRDHPTQTPQRPSTVSAPPTQANIITRNPDGTTSQRPNPNYTPPKQAAEAKPDRITSGGKVFERGPEGNWQVVLDATPPEKAAKPTTHVIGGRIYRLDPDGNVLGVTDARTPEELTKSGLDITKTGLEIEKDRQALLPQQQLIIQKQLQTIEYVKSLVASGQLKPEQADQYIQNVKDASLAALRGTTPFEEQQQAQKVQNEAAGQATDLLRQRLATAGSVGDSFMTSILSGATHARLGPGQHLNIDPLALAKAYILENGGAEAQGATAGLLSRAGLPGGAHSAPGGPPAPIAAGLMAGAGIPGPSAPMSPGSYPVLQPPRGVPVALAPGAPAGV